MEHILSQIEAESQERNSSLEISLNRKIAESKNSGLFEYFPEEHRQKAEHVLFEINKSKAELSEKVLAYECTSLKDFLSIEVDFTNQSKASEILALQDEIKHLLKKEEEFLEIARAVFIEPAKIHKTVDIAEKILCENDFGIYQRSGRLVRIIKHCHVPKPKNKKTQQNEQVKRSPDTLIIREIDPIYLSEMLNKQRLWIKKDNRSKDEIRPVDCPTRIATHLIARCEWEHFPVLTGVINTPTLRPDGSILDTPGYDDETGLLFIPEGIDFGKIPLNPTKDDAHEALDLLLDLLRDFPFEENESDGDYQNTNRSVALSSILTAQIRKSIPTAPIHGFSAPKMASGKSLLADVVALITSGNCCTMLSHAENEAEEKKRLIAVLLEGDPVVCFDNIERPFGSPALCIVLTQEKYKDRILGETKTTEALTNISFLATGNNLTFIGDLSTRALMCKLDPKVERPEERSFDIDLREYIRNNRAKLVRAGLIILRAYHVAGRPNQNIKPYGRFEAWSNWVRSAIVWLGETDPCLSRKEIESADPVRIALGNLLAAWYSLFDDMGKKINDVIKRAENKDEKSESLYESLIEIAPDGKGGINGRSLGKKLAQFKGRIESGYRLEQLPPNQGVAMWRVKKV